MKVIWFLFTTGVGASRWASKEVIAISSDETADLLCNICRDADVEVTEDDKVNITKN